MKNALKFAAKIALLWFVVAGFCALILGVVAHALEWMTLGYTSSWWIPGFSIGAGIGTGITWQLTRGRFGVQ